LTPPVDQPQPLGEHLEELRRRLLWVLVWLALFSVVAYFFVDPILNWLAKPVGEFVFTAPTEAFFIRLQIAFGVGAVAAFPIAVYNVWKFISLGLAEQERSWITVIVPVSLLLFLLGAVLALFGVAPIASAFLLHFSSPTLKPMISLDAYLSFLFWMILGFGVFFQLPLIIVILSRLGVINPRTLGKYRRHAIVGIFLAAAVLTPGPDVFSQLLLGLPAYLLFEVSLLLARRFEKK
jgi:sec-independent protein translocase protein TatC